MPDPALDAALRRVGDRWSLLHVAALLDGARRFGALQAALPGIAPNTLSGRLRQLEEDGLIETSRYSERPPRHEYALTAEGRALGLVVGALAAWAGSPPQHELCGTPMELRWWCPSCAAFHAPDDEVEHL